MLHDLEEMMEGGTAALPAAPSALVDVEQGPGFVNVQVTVILCDFQPSSHSLKAADRLSL